MDLGRQAAPGQILERAREAVAGPDLARPVAPDEQQWELGRDLRERGDQQQARLVGPVQIFETEHERPAPRGALDETAEPVQQVAPLLVGRKRRRLADVVVDPVQLRHEPSHLGRVVPEQHAERLRRAARARA